MEHSVHIESELVRNTSWEKYDAMKQKNKINLTNVKKYRTQIKPTEIIGAS